MAQVTPPPVSYREDRAAWHRYHKNVGMLSRTRANILVADLVGIANAALEEIDRA